MDHSEGLTWLQGWALALNVKSIQEQDGMGEHFFQGLFRRVRALLDVCYVDLPYKVVMVDSTLGLSLRTLRLK